MVDQLKGSYAALNRRDIDGTMAVLDEHATWVEHSDLPEAGSYRGRDTIRHFLEQFLDSWDDFEQHIEEVHAGGRLRAAVHPPHGEWTGQRHRRRVALRAPVGGARGAAACAWTPTTTASRR